MNEQVSYPLSRLDRISGLPDGIICTILSRLPVEESARTTILSKRWCKIWALSPITISDESILKQSHTYSSTEECSTYSSWLINTLSHIISTHLGPIHTCHFILPTWHDHPQTLVKLLKTLTLKGIQNLKIYGKSCVFSVPDFVFECESLVDVDFHHVSIHDPSRCDTETFPNLKKLTLLTCEVFFVSLFSSKSIIELNLSGTFPEEVVIESHSLQKFSFSTEDYTKLILKDVPNLESFSYDNPTKNCEVVILDAPKLKVLGCIDMHILMLQLGSYRFRFHKQYMKISGEIAHMTSLRSLNIIVDVNRGHEGNAVPLMLKCFPCLEILQIKIIDEGEYYTPGSSSESSDSSDDDNEDDDDLLVVNDHTNYGHLTSYINCLNHHLKVLRIENYSVTASQADVADLVIKKAKGVFGLFCVLCFEFSTSITKYEKNEEKWNE